MYELWSTYQLYMRFFSVHVRTSIPIYRTLPHFQRDNLPQTSHGFGFGLWASWTDLICKVEAGRITRIAIHCKLKILDGYYYTTTPNIWPLLTLSTRTTLWPFLATRNLSSPEWIKLFPWIRWKHLFGHSFTKGRYGKTYSLI